MRATGLRRTVFFAATLALCAGLLHAESALDKAKTASKELKHAEAEKLLRSHIEEYPETVEAYRLLAETLEILEKKEDAAQAWLEFRILTTNAPDIALANARITRLTGKKTGNDPAGELTAADIFAMTTVAAQWYTRDSEHFEVRARNEKLAQYVSNRAEAYLASLCMRWLKGSAYPHKLPITVYGTHAEYTKSGAPPWSQGGTVSDYTGLDGFLAGRMERRIELLQILPNGKLNTDLTSPRLLPHELTHLVLSEYFGESRPPLWLNEGIAQCMEETRGTEAESELYKVCQSTPIPPIPLSTLIDLPGYPSNVASIAWFYLESASFTAFLLNRLGDDKFAQFMTLIKRRQKGREALRAVLPDGSEAAMLEQLQKDWIGSLKKPAEPPK